MRTSATAVILALALVLATTAAACGGGGAAGPAWPRSAGRVDGPADKDGGESLEPQQASYVLAIERSEDKTVATAAPPAPAVAPTEAAEAAPGEAAPPTPAPAPAGEVEIEVIELDPEDLEPE